MSAPEDTGSDREPAEAKPYRPMPPVEHRFKPGNPGRPKGSRNKLGEEFISALQQDFAEHGIDAIARVRLNKPSDYLKVIASLVPQQIEFRTPREELTDDELDRLIGALERAKEGQAPVVVSVTTPADLDSPSAPALPVLVQAEPVAVPVAVADGAGASERCNEATAELTPTPHRVDQPSARAQGGPIPQPPGQKSS